MFREDFAGRVLPFDSAAAETYARIASIALCRGASLATRNLAGFQGCDLAPIDPWAD